MIKCYYQLCTFASTNSKFKVQPCGACISFLRLRLVVFIIECNKVGFPFPFLQFSTCEKADFVQTLGNNFIFLLIFYLSIHVSE